MSTIIFIDEEKDIFWHGTSSMLDSLLDPLMKLLDKESEEYHNLTLAKYTDVLEFHQLNDDLKQQFRLSVEMCLERRVNDLHKLQKGTEKYEHCLRSIEMFQNLSELVKA